MEDNIPLRPFRSLPSIWSYWDVVFHENYSKWLAISDKNTYTSLTFLINKINIKVDLLNKYPWMGDRFQSSNKQIKASLGCLNLCCLPQNSHKISLRLSYRSFNCCDLCIIFYTLELDHSIDHVDIWDDLHQAKWI